MSLLFLALASGNSTLQAQGVKTYTVRGQILSLLDGLPLPGIQVNLKGTQLSAITDSSGTFAIQGVSPGVYDLIAKYPDFDATILRDITVPPRSRKSFVFNLKPEQPRPPLPLISAEVADSLGILEGTVRVKIDSFRSRFEKGWLLLKAIVIGKFSESYLYPRQWRIMPVEEQQFRFKFALPVGKSYRLLLIWQEQNPGFVYEKILDVFRRPDEPEKARILNLTSQKYISEINFELDANKIVE